MGSFGLDPQSYNGLRRAQLDAFVNMPLALPTTVAARMGSFGLDPQSYNGLRSEASLQDVRASCNDIGFIIFIFLALAPAGQWQASELVPGTTGQVVRFNT